ncbi:AI-2E family transporter [Halomicrococcus sp. NG-SE-24]|uniref:AI-2E family transporter n=1 Tax=Halomicrococcus sp. NG-SE-24 TaxID=3436928 RepID=UPI003D96D0F1
MDWNDILDRDRNRIAWWLFLATLGVGVLFVGYSYVGTFVFGLFIYYASRPAYQRIRSVVGSDGTAAAATLLGATLPLLALVTYIAVMGLQNAASMTGLHPDQHLGLLQPFVNVQALTSSQQDLLSTFLNRPFRVLSGNSGQLRELLSTGLSVLGVVATGLVHVALAFGFAFYLLRDDDRIAAWFSSSIASKGSAAHAYATAVDDDLETIFFGNVLFVFAVALVAAVVYNGFNAVAPSALSIPFAILLALLTGVTSLVPLVVGKLVYVPIVLYVGGVAVTQGGLSLVFPAGLLVVCFLFLDILPQTFLQPYISGRQTHTGMMMFAYLLGPMLFGWYGFFLLPMFLVLVLQAVRIVLSELLHGDRLTPRVTTAESLGASPEITDSTESTASDDSTGGDDSTVSNG